MRLVNGLLRESGYYTLKGDFEKRIKNTYDGVGRSIWESFEEWILSNSSPHIFRYEY